MLLVWRRTSEYWILVFPAPVSSLQSKMTERPPWWKAFLTKKKPGGPKDAGSSQTFGPDFDPFAQRPDKQKETPTAASKTTGDQTPSLQDPSKRSSLLSDETYDDTHLESVFNEQTCRRNMKVSRSGRFKEKRRVRSSLPLQEKETENVTSGKEDMRWRGGKSERLLADAWWEGEGGVSMKMLQTLEAFREVYCMLVMMVKMEMTRSIQLLGE